MVTIRRRYGGKEAVFNVWSRSEADRQGIVYKPWRKSLPGQWALSDDHHVAQCLRLQVFKEGKGRVRRVFTFPYGRIWDSPGVILSFAERAAVGNWSATSPKSWIEVEARRTRAKNVVKLYVHQKLATGKVDYETLGKAYRPDQLIPAATVRRLLKQSRIKEMIDRETSEIMAAHGWSVPKVMRHFNALIEDAKNHGDLRALRLTLEHMTKLLGMLPSKRR